MINIISRSYISNNITGPQKVVSNLIKGLDILGYPYCINKALESTSQLWIHDDNIALKEASKRNLKAIVGPNIYILPRNIPLDLNLSNFVYIHPSKWSADFWRDFGFNRCRLDCWPSGIDTDEFSLREKPKNGTVLIYFKQRRKNELEYIKNILKNLKIKYEIIIYGSYKQKDYLRKLKNTKYIIWIGRQESQGIALEEALSMNVPILVWDILNMGHWVPENKKEADILNKEEQAYANTTSAYYFDERCGIKTKDRNYIQESIKVMEEKWDLFTPREFIIENLGLKKQAQDMIELFDNHFKIKYDDGRIEFLKSTKKWRNDKLLFKIFIYIKKQIKFIKNLLK